MNAKRNAIALCLLAAALAGCSGMATPQLIGSFPRYPTPTPYVASGLMYSTDLDMEVADVAAAAQQATELAYQSGGYLAASESLGQGQYLHTTLTLSVPGTQFAALRASVVSLGRLSAERSVNAPAPWASDLPALQSTVTVTFWPARPVADSPYAPHLFWSPAGTLRQAFSVLGLISTILLDIAIWVGVVLGPFALIALGLRWLVRQRRRPAG